MSRREKAMVAAIVALLFALSWQSTRQRSTARALREAQLYRADTCRTARALAIATLQMEILLERTREPSDQRRREIRSRSELGVYVFACNPERHDIETDDMAGILNQKVMGLFAVGDIVALEELADKLHDTPLERWKELDLPETPSLFMQLSHGDAQEAADLEEALSPEGGP